MVRGLKFTGECFLLGMSLGALAFAGTDSDRVSPKQARTLSPGIAVHNPGAVNDSAIAAPDAAAKPCTVTLFSNYTFQDYSGQAFQYAPTCPGPWSRVVFKGSFNVSEGIQFDRTANIQLGYVNIYFGTTEEPSPDSAPSWNVTRDLTDYSSLFTSAQAGEVDIYNIVNSQYTGIIYGTASLEFYPVAAGGAAPVTADVVYPLPDGPGAPYELNTGSDQLTATFTLPTNIERAYLDVVSQGQSGDEFWYTCVPNDVSGELFSCGNTAFRETEISIDGQPAGIAPVFPWIFTGGIDPYLWIPIPGVQTLNFAPYRVDLTPFAGLLSNGQPHTIALSVFNANSYFQSVASLLVYEDHGSTQVTGAVTANTLAAPTPVVQENLNVDPSGNITGTVNTTSSHVFTIAGYVNTSHGKVTTSVSQTENFSNHQSFDITDTVYQQNIAQGTTVNSRTSITNASGTVVVSKNFSFPLIVDIAESPNAEGVIQVTSISQTYSSNQSQGSNPPTSLVQNVKTTDTLQFDPSFNLLGNSNQKSSSEATSTANGKCISVLTTAANNVIVSQGAGPGCK